MEISNEVPNTSQNNLSEENVVENEAIMNEAENEEVSQMTLEALDQIPDIIEKLGKDNTQYDLHVQLIDLLKQTDLPEQLEDARLAMHDIYPLSENLWLDWINDAKKEATSEEGERRLLHLYDEAEKDYFSIDIWKSYTEFILEKFYKAFEEMDQENDLIDSTREDLLKAVRATVYHVKRSQEIWRLYVQFEIDIMNKFKNPNQVERVKKVYLDRLNVLHIDCEETFNGYSTYITAWDNNNYEDNMIQANKTYADTKRAADERDIFEQKLIAAQYSIDAFYEYIENEKVAKNKFSLNNVRCLYERAILIYCTDPNLWNDYILFLVEKARVQSFLENTFDKALSSQQLLASIEDLVAVLLAKCNYYRRKIDWEDPAEEDVMNLRVAFEESLVYLHEAFPESGDPYCRVEKFYARISTRLGDIDKARELWEHIVRKNGRSAEAWIQYIYFERDLGNYVKCQTLFKKSIIKRIDDPTRLIEVWNSIEYEMGSLESYEDALVRINSKTKMLTNEWHAQLVEQEEKEQRKISKELEIKRKKGLHRMQQKQKQKEKQVAAVQEEGKEELGAGETEPIEKETSNVLKRKATSENIDQGIKKPRKEDHEVRRDRHFRAPRPPKRGKAIALGTSRISQDKSEAQVSESSSNIKNENKSNDDFRAMLLGKNQMPTTNEIKCKLQRHYKIPIPILEILVGNLPQVSSSIKEVIEETLDDQKEETDGSDKEWAWGADEDAVSNRTDFTTRSPSPNVQSKEAYLISSSASGRTLVLAYKTKFITVKVNAEGEYSAIGQNTKLENEIITSLLCLPLFVPSTRSTQNYIMCGYKSGWVRVFSESGVLLTEQRLETTPVLSIKMRTPPPVFKVSSLSQPKEDEDITILFEGKKVVSIDGQSLWLVLRICDGQRESGIDASRMHTAFQYKKWELQHQDQVKDVVSLGPSSMHSQVPDFHYPNATSTRISSNASARYIGVGVYPMLTYYATAESTRTLSAASMATYVVSRVASPVFSFAKSWWGTTANNSANQKHAGTPYVPDMPQPPTNVEPATPIPAILSANDPYRQINHIYICPPSTSAQRHTLAATSDALGRVILWDVVEGEMIRMWKGVRDAACGWVEAFEHELYQQQAPAGPPKVLQFLVIHSSKLGSLRIFQMRHGKQVGAFHIGPGWKLVPCAREPLGSSMVSLDRRKKAKELEKSEYGLLSSCLLISPDGDVRKIEITIKSKSREAGDQ
ncbi:hypothetical protein G6F57_006162 [Rhizopus arrhizus]|nr:hypothetical protein G6F24_005790 [Rhizopus arrhizus]KAG1424545.1 hypothetical protein G6F58_002320 [Rhizopus delemar]KAG0950040.1 hypothetical protein G6F30_001886 [Rhizopus arrhizus]KAG0980955.1 hypothetical protein G6F29_007440 [Rhizopus arrhizus]KAG0993228.1 hypothetical protein G6F28_006891 [Rhizopus arrhizus]